LNIATPSRPRRPIGQPPLCGSLLSRPANLILPPWSVDPAELENSQSAEPVAEHRINEYFFQWH
jgi:hypothetical protein